MFGISGEEFIVILVVAAIVLGPERLPRYTQQLTNLVRSLRRMAAGASEQVRNELGPEFDEIDWSKLDPRQYDPRRIVRDALSDTFDPDDPLGMRSVGDDLRAQADELRQAADGTLADARALDSTAVRQQRRVLSSGDATSAATARADMAATGTPEAQRGELTAPAWDPDTL